MPVLSDARIRALKPREKPYKQADFDGLYLLVKPNGSKLWRFKYRWLQKEKLLALGRYPELTLADARRKCAQLLHPLSSDFRGRHRTEPVPPISDSFVARFDA